MNFETFVPQSFPITGTLTTALHNIACNDGVCYTRGYKEEPLKNDYLPKCGDLVDGLLFPMINIPKKIFVNYLSGDDSTRVKHEYIINESDLSPFQLNNECYMLWQPTDFLVPILKLYYTAVSLQTSPEIDVNQIIPVFGFLKRDIRESIIHGENISFLKKVNF